MFSEYVARAEIAEHVERLRSAAVVEHLARCARSARPTLVRAAVARASHVRLPLHLSRPLAGAARPQPCGC